MQIILFCLSIGKDPVGLKLAIVNHELNNSRVPCSNTTQCDAYQLSCRYLSHLSRRKVVYLNYDTEMDARYAVTKGWAWGAITFPKNYSESLKERIENGRDAKDLESADMTVVMDSSSELSNIFWLKTQSSKSCLE